MLFGAAETFSTTLLTEIFAIQKLIVADSQQESTDQGKSRKDCGQAAFLISVLATDRPDDLAEAYLVAVSRGPRWPDSIASILELMPEAAGILTKLR